jgi:hypothetical protein
MQHTARLPMIDVAKILDLLHRATRTARCVVDGTLVKDLLNVNASNEQQLHPRHD